MVLGMLVLVDRQPEPTSVTPVTRTTYSPDPTSRPTEPSTAATTTSPTAAPPSTTGAPVLPGRSWDALPAPHSQDPSWLVLQRNELNGQPIPMMACPGVPDRFTTTGQFKAFATGTLACQHEGWSTTFAAVGQPLPMPSVTFVTDGVQTPCGRAGDEVSFYCGTWDGSSYGIYVQMNLLEQSNEWWRLRAFETLAHEFGHHVQMMNGTMYHSNQLVSTGELEQTEASRRLELQTSCWASRLLYQTPATRFSRADHDELVLWSQEDQDEWHGSAASNQYWWQRGLYMDRVGGCNTWTVDAARVG